MSFDFDDIFELPFFLDKSSTSVLRRYIEAHNERYDDFTDRLEEVLESRQIDQAEGEELDRIGAAFGVLGRRRGRSDQEYRIYLKSLVQSFKGRGTVPGIISAVAAGLNTDEENVEVNEDFENLEYVIRLEDWPAHRGSTIEELAELADASVAQQIRTEYDVDEEEMGVSDTASATVSTLIEAEDVSIDDTAIVESGTPVTETVGSDDLAEVNPDLITFAEEVDISDLAEVNPDLTEFAEDVGIADEGVPRRRGEVEEITIADPVGVDSDLTTESEDVGVADEGVPRRRGQVEDLSLDDVVTINPNKTTAADSSGSSDNIQDVSTTTVSWDEGNWDEMNWATEHN